MNHTLLVSTDQCELVFCIDTGVQASVWFHRKWHVKKGNLVAFLNFQGETSSKQLKHWDLHLK